jgi:curved DNA-binding protein CbpA
MTSSPYAVLKIDKYSTTDDIRKSYKRLMKKHHPDTGDGDRETFDKVRLAYIQLKDKKTQKWCCKDTQHNSPYNKARLILNFRH